MGCSTTVPFPTADTDIEATPQRIEQLQSMLGELKDQFDNGIFPSITNAHYPSLCLRIGGSTISPCSYPFVDFIMNHKSKHGELNLRTISFI
jgi:hypothetical protein